jgi:hypothetical protein
MMLNIGHGDQGYGGPPWRPSRWSDLFQVVRPIFHSPADGPPRYSVRQWADLERLSGPVADDKTNAKTKSLKRIGRKTVNDPAELFA